MKKWCVLCLAVAPGLSWANDTDCAKVGASMYVELTTSIVRDLHIDAESLQERHAAVDVLAITPVSEVFAEHLATIDSETQIGIKLKKEDFFESYYTNGAKSITAKYTFTNGEGKRDVFIASSLLNKDECSVRFNGYLTLSREF
ncbi:MAG: Shiga toxin A subunit [Ewingella sp.]